MERNLPTVDIICPIRNREFVLSYFLDHIYKLNYPKDKISIIFCINDSIDASDQILRKFKKDNKNEYKDIKILTYNLKSPTDERIKGYRQNIFEPLSKVRNYLLSQTTSEYIFSVDSDILVQIDTLKRLVKADKDIISAIIYNGHVFSPEKPWRYTNIMNKNANGQYIHFSRRHRTVEYKNNCIVEVDMTGAVYLMTAEVAHKIKYAFHPNGEDFAFCQDAQDKGFSIFSNINLFCFHAMDKDLLDKYLAKKETKENNND